ncbi:ribonuclease HI [Aureimonas sp. D3]|uniref:ribonuclease HI n=1 Tax=Aureimonas sp. D3 TaxID=1638164 RepID=UPI00078252FB|nr:ribonuclease HI [Aureimonas sp. D3]
MPSKPPPKETLTGDYITIHTDGSCLGNPGPGGFAALLRRVSPSGSELKRKEITGCEAYTTNQRMELRAAIAGLAALKGRTLPIIVIADSQYLLKGMAHWLANWKANGWRSASQKTIANLDLWQELDALAAGRSITWEWVKGHAGDPLNGRVDALANAAALTV